MNLHSKTRLLLLTGVVLIAAGIVLNMRWISPGKAVSLYVLLPVGAIFLGLSLVSRMLENETPGYDEDHRHAAGDGSARSTVHVSHTPGKSPPEA